MARIHIQFFRHKLKVSQTAWTDIYAWNDVHSDEWNMEISLNCLSAYKSLFEV